MRITNTMITNRMITNINSNLTKIDNYYTQMSTQKKIQMPSDDPIIASRALKYRTTVSETTQYKENSTQASSWLEITESTFNNINAIYAKMRELSLQGSTDSYTDSDREKILEEFDSLIVQLEEELNVTYMGRYIFSGYKTDTPVIIKDDAGNHILNPDIYGENASAATHPIDGQSINIEIGVDSYIDINSFATDVYTAEMYDTLHALRGYVDSMKAAGDDTAKQEEALAELQNIMGDATIEDFRDGFDSMIGKIDQFLAEVSVEHTRVGVKLNRLELTQTRLADDYANYSTLMSSNEDVNLAEVAMNYNTANAVYNAALKVGMSITQYTLVDYL